MPVEAGPAASRACAILTVDLGAIVGNYRSLRSRLGGVAAAAVVKADAYGLGAEAVAPALAAAGAEIFFTAQLEEAVRLRRLLPAAEIYVLNGLMPGAEADYPAHSLRPVLNTLEEVARYRASAGGDADAALPAALHVDTGMSRLGLTTEDLIRLTEDSDGLRGLEIAYLISHLACAEQPEHPINTEQLARFEDARRQLPTPRASLANSPGIFLGPEYHFDLARPGAALYGVNPTPGSPNPMRQAIRLQGKMLQVRTIDAPQSVGYGATFRASGPMRIATVGIGYADGYLRALSNRGRAWLGDKEVPVVGRVSMDLITLDVTGAPEATTQPGALVDMIGPHQDIDSVARQAGTIGYEMLTALGRRYHRIYKDG